MLSLGLFYEYSLRSVYIQMAYMSGKIVIVFSKISRADLPWYCFLGPTCFFVRFCHVDLTSLSMLVLL